MKLLLNKIDVSYAEFFQYKLQVLNIEAPNGEHLEGRYKTLGLIMCDSNRSTTSMDTMLVIWSLKRRLPDQQGLTRYRYRDPIRWRGVLLSSG
jgi:hypothetical protein